MAKPTSPRKKYKLQNVDEPNLYRNMFPYVEIPRVMFEDDAPAMAPAKRFLISDTTFRDGQQARPPYAIQQVVDLFTLLNKLDGGAGLITHSEFFLYSDRDRKAVEQCLSLGFDFPQVTGWIRAVAADFKLVKEMKLKETGILTSCSDYHIFLKLKKTRKQVMNQYLSIVKDALNEGVIPRCHLEDITRADFYGFVVPFAIEMNKLRQETGIDMKLRLCDTMGFGVPWANTALPRSVPKLVAGIINEAGYPGELLEWHGHNDFHKVLINPSTAWLYGCATCNGSLLGIGERTGNTPIEAMVIEAAQLSGQDSRINYKAITEIAEYYRKQIGYPIPDNYPIVGEEFNITRAGIHADGLLKCEEIYSAFDTGNILNTPPGVAITDKSGAAGIKHWIQTHYDIDVPKDDSRLQALRQTVDTEYEAGRTTAISNEEMHRWFALAFGRPAKK
jgi:isopropylmalate/homocitrate/citramalate synthase